MNGFKRLVSFFMHLNPAHSDVNNLQPSAAFKVQVMFINGCDLPTLRRYRVSHQREQLELHGVATNEVHYTKVAKYHAVQADAFIIYRCPITDEVESFITEVHKLGKIILFDVDDLVIDTRYTNELPVVKAMNADDRALFNDGVERNGRTLKLCDGAIATTERLAIELRKYIPNVFINRNVASQEMLYCSNKAIDEIESHDSSKIILGYFSGSMTHNKDFAEIVPALGYIFEHYPNVYLKVVGDLGLPSELKGYSSRLLHAEKVDWRDLPSLIASVDINLAPLENTIFNEAKSENKWTEAALVKVPTIASNFGAFSHSIKNGETGLLCSNTDEWINSLTMLVTDKSTRERIGAAARLDVEQRYITATSGFSLVELLTSAPRDLDHICPSSDDAKRLLVANFLKNRGYTTLVSASGQSASWKTRSLSDSVEECHQLRNSNKKILLLIYERDCGDDATFRYFGSNLEERLSSSSLWGASHLFVDELAASKDLIGNASAIMLIRCRIRPELLELAKEAKQRQIPLAYFIDDNAIGAKRAPRIIKAMATNQNSEFERNFWTGVCNRFKLASDLCDAIVAPNDFFASIIGEEEEKPVYVLQSSLNDAQVATARAISGGSTAGIDDRFLIGYFSGTSSHQEDFLQAEKALVSFLKKHPKSALVLGGHYSLDNDLYELYIQGSLIPIPAVDYITLQYLQASVDVVLAPLVLDDFTNCKSALKVFEAGLVGTPACASNSFSYAEAIEDGKSGYICNTAAEWEAALEALHSNRHLLSLMSNNAKERALSRYYGDRVLRNDESLCNKLEKTAILPFSSSVEEKIGNHPQTNWDDPFSVNPSFAH